MFGGGLMDCEYSKCDRKVRELLDTMVNFIGIYLRKQLKQVRIPMFTSDKTRYESWKAAVMACIDSASATPRI